MPGRIGEHITDPTMIRCCCGTSALYCETCMDNGARCCQCCDHIHSMETLARYGMLET